MKLKKIKLKIIVILTLFTGFHIILYKENIEQDNEKAVKVLETKIAVNENKNIFKNSQILEPFDPNSWIFNNKVAQYGSKLILLNNDQIVIEALAFFDYFSQNINFIKSNAIKCLLKIDNMIKTISITEAINIQTWIVSNGSSRYLWRVRCVVEKSFHLFKFSQIQVAISDYSEYKKISQYYIPESFVSFHKPNFYDSKIPKNKSLGHCVHMMFDVEGERLKRFFNWFDVQKKFGVDKFRLYFYRVKPSSEIEIRKRLGNNAEIFHTQLNYEFICKYYHYYLEKSHKSKVSKYLLQNCLNLYRIYFDNNINGVFSAHEKVCTNDCLLNFKHQYEFITNYDFDEFIFPRKLKTNDYKDFNTNNCHDLNYNLNDGLNYNLYEYASRLSKLHSGNVAVLSFNHVLYVQQGYKEFLNTLFRAVAKISNNLNKEIKIDYNYMNSQTKLTFNINSMQFIQYINEIKHLQPSVKCFNKTLIENKFFELIWNTPYAIFMNMRMGKSIYNTNFTETYNQHCAEAIAPNSFEFDVPIEDGFVSHFREHIEGFFTKQHYSFYHFRFDIEFYKFLATFK